MAVIVGLAAAILFLGEWLLNSEGLTWRVQPKVLLSAVTWLSGLVAGVLTIWYVGRCPFTRGEGLRFLQVCSRTAALLCFICVMFVGSGWGLAWLGLEVPATEQVGTYQGQKVVQAEWHWLGDTSYSLHEYHGPLVRGIASLEPEWEMGPYLDEDDTHQ